MPILGDERKCRDGREEEGKKENLRSPDNVEFLFGLEGTLNSRVVVVADRMLSLLIAIRSCRIPHRPLEEQWSDFLERQRNCPSGPEAAR